jgi:plasmid maintenance system antidote protein VapI
MSLTSQLREAIHKSGLSLYAVAKRTETPYAAIHAFANSHRGLTLETADRLAELFKMKLTSPNFKAAKSAGPVRSRKNHTSKAKE